MFGIHRRFHLMEGGGRLNKFILKHNNFFCLLPMMAFFLLLFFLIPTFFESTKETQANTCSVYFTVMALDLDGNNSMDVLDEVSIVTSRPSSTETIYDESYAYTTELIFTKPQTIALIYIINIKLKDGYYAELDERALDFMPPNWNNSLSNTSVMGTCTIDLSNDNTSFLILYRTQKKYQIEYDLKNGTHGREHPTSAGYGDSVTISNPTRTDGYHFTGWTLSNYLSTAQYRTSSSWYNYTGGLTTYTSFRRLQQDGATVKFTANWKINTYRVRFNANGGSGNNMSDQSFTYGTSQNLTKNSFTRAGHTFAGWNTKADGSGTPYSDSARVSNLTTTNGDTVTLYAQWTAQNLKVNFNYNGGTVVKENDSQPYSSNGTRLSEIPPKKEMSRTGYTFKGWSLTPNDTGVYYDADTNWNNVSVSVDNKDVCISDAGVGNIEFNLYAIWEANEYSVNVNIYNPNGVEEYTSNINGTFTLRDDEGNVITGLYNEPSDHYITFGKSWQVYDIVAGTGRKLRTTNPVTCGSGLTMSENNGVYTFTCTGTSGHTINIYMEYISYKIAFNGNDNTGGSMDTIENVKYDSDQKLTANGFIKAGYVFTGWNTKDDGSGKSYLDKETVKNLTSVDGATVTLYAQWEETWANHASSSLETTEINGVTYNVIASAEDLAYLSKQSISSTLLGKYIQTADIDLSDYTWLPIGSENAFCGEYLGQGHKITGLKTCDAVDADDVYLQTYGGLFGKLGKNSTNGASANIVGVYITDCLVYGQYSGAIAGFSDDESVNIDSVNIEACILENVKIYGDTNTTASFVGSSSDGQIKDCLLISSNILTANTTTRGFYTGTMTIKSCYFVENNSATRFTGASSDYSNWVTGVFKYPLPKALIWYPGA